MQLTFKISLLVSVAEQADFQPNQFTNPDDRFSRSDAHFHLLKPLCADPEVGTGVPNNLNNLLAILVRIPLKIANLCSQHSLLGHHH